ncbi:MAG: hypothetical protein ACTHJT_09530 [Cytophaga sp.]|uniref:hypothetical protein n=1 Tax=Cytophaga sp. TaxID=29535 RepID=UPI003F7E405D
MKKSFRLLITIICFLGASSVYAQWTTSGSNVSLTTTTNNVIIGPTPTTPTNLYLNSTASSTTTLSIDNNASGTYTPHTSSINFNALGTTQYKIYMNINPNCSNGLLNLGNAISGPGIHIGKNTMTFSSTLANATCGNDVPVEYLFDGVTGIKQLEVGLTTSDLRNSTFSIPTGYTFHVASGASYFNDKVVIGTTNTSLPTGTHKLYVGGSMVSEEIFVKLQANWPDFVFSPQYKLRPLSEVKTFITQNNHLPDVPAACEVEESGVATGEMLTIQMKKIEELTLYMIQMQEENEALKKRIEALEVK